MGQFEILVPKGGYCCYKDLVACRLVLNDSYVALQGARSKLPSDIACASANYGHFCTALLGFFFADTNNLGYYGSVQKNLNPLI